MMSDHSITYWFEELRRGDPEAARELWERFFGRLVRYARSQMADVNRRVADEEDIAAGVMAALCQCAQRNSLPQIDNRDDLWQMLLAWIRHDVTDQVRLNMRLKRGGGKVRGDSVFAVAGSIAGFDEIGDGTEPADVLMEMDEQCERLMSLLANESLRSIARYRLHGFTDREIAELMDISPRTVERKLSLIRSKWQR